MKWNPEYHVLKMYPIICSKFQGQQSWPKNNWLRDIDEGQQSCNNSHFIKLAGRKSFSWKEFKRSDFRPCTYAMDEKNKMFPHDSFKKWRRLICWGVFHTPKEKYPPLNPGPIIIKCIVDFRYYSTNFYSFRTTLPQHCKWSYLFYTAC